MFSGIEIMETLITILQRHLDVTLDALHTVRKDSIGNELVAG